jgi:hypothetical protein
MMIGARVGVTDGVGVRHGGTPRGVGVDVGVAVAARNKPGVTGVGQVCGVDVSVGLGGPGMGVAVPTGPGVGVLTGPGVGVLTGRVVVAVAVGRRVGVNGGAALVCVGAWIVTTGVA